MDLQSGESVSAVFRDMCADLTYEARVSPHADETQRLYD